MKHSDLHKASTLAHHFAAAKQTRKQLDTVLRSHPEAEARATIHNINVDLSPVGRRIVLTALIEAMDTRLESLRDQLAAIGVTEVD